MFLGGQYFGEFDQRSKVCLILDKDRHRYQRFISDISGKDVQSHDGKPERAITVVRNWLNSWTKGVILPGPIKIQSHFREFSRSLPEYFRQFGIRPKELQFNDYVVFAEEWLKENAPTI